MWQENLTSIFMYLSKRLYLIKLSRIYKGTIYNYSYRNNRVLFDKKHRCYISRNSKKKVTYSGSFCKLHECTLKIGTCKECYFNQEL